MRNCLSAIAVATAVVGLAASAASANFIFSNTRTTFTSSGNSFDRVTVYAFNDGTGYTAGGSKLLAMELTAASSGTIRFAANSFNGVATDEAAALTASTSVIAAGTQTDTKIVSELFTTDFFSLFPSNPHQNPDGSFYALGADVTSGNHGIPAGAGVNGGAGAAFLTLVTTPGATVTLSGGIAGETGTAGGLLIGETSPGHFAFESASGGLNLTPFSYTATAPEPTTLASLSAAVLLGARRARRAARA